MTIRAASAAEQERSLTMNLSGIELSLILSHQYAHRPAGPRQDLWRGLGRSPQTDPARAVAAMAALRAKGLLLDINVLRPGSAEPGTRLITHPLISMLFQVLEVAPTLATMRVWGRTLGMDRHFFVRAGDQLISLTYHESPDSGPEDARVALRWQPFGQRAAWVRDVLTEALSLPTETEDTGSPVSSSEPVSIPWSTLQMLHTLDEHVPVDETMRWVEATGVQDRMNEIGMLKPPYRAGCSVRVFGPEGHAERSEWLLAGGGTWFHTGVVLPGIEGLRLQFAALLGDNPSGESIGEALEVLCEPLPEARLADDVVAFFDGTGRLGGDDG